MVEQPLNHRTEMLERERPTLRRSLVMGLTRSPIAAPDWLASGDQQKDTLALVAALGLRSRFDRSDPPERFVAQRIRHDADRLLHGDARVISRRLFGNERKSVHSAVALRILDAFAQRGVRLHPFDYPYLKDLMSADISILDSNARAWLAGFDKEDRDERRFEDIGDDNWTEFQPAERAQFLRTRRSEDPGAARLLCAEAIGNDAASVRAKLVTALAVGLGLDDVEFLASLDKDRAPTVRKIAASLLGRIKGTPAFAERLQEARDALELTSARIIGRRKVLKLNVPKSVAKVSVSAWVHQTFTDLNPAELARAFDLPADQFAAAIGEPALRRVLFATALELGDGEMAMPLASEFDADDAWQIVSGSRERLGALDTAGREVVWSSFAQTVQAADLSEACELMALLYESLRQAPPPALMESLAGSRQSKQWLKRARSELDCDETLVPEMLIALADTGARAAWRERFGDLPQALTSAAFALADLLDAIESHASSST